ncbi:MAG: hypothetical protein WCJ58_03390 [bacterium]
MANEFINIGVNLTEMSEPCANCGFCMKPLEETLITLGDRLMESDIDTVFLNYFYAQKGDGFATLLQQNITDAVCTLTDQTPSTNILVTVDHNPNTGIINVSCVGNPNGFDLEVDTDNWHPIVNEIHERKRLNNAHLN